jgi:arylsulfatase A-like enzyme
MAWIHYYAPHAPYVARPGFPFGRGRENAYLSEAAYFDRQLGDLMRYLAEDGWLEDTLVVFFSDHGEALGERGYYGHHVYLDGWMVDVPLVVWHADLPPAEAQVGVSVADIAPTVLHFLGLPQRSDLPAQSLFTLDRDAAGRPTFSEAFPVRGEALFASFRLPALDDATIAERLRSIRTASRGYEPKGAVTLDRYRLIHHRAADATWTYVRNEDGSSSPIASAEVSKSLRRTLDRWEGAQLRRIECRLRVSAPRPR